MTKSLYDGRWQRRRAAQLRKHPACKFCQDFEGRLVPATVADHITPHRGDPVLFAGPLQSLCATCHNSRKQQLERTGAMRGCDADGMPLDPNHPWRIELDRERAAELVEGGRVLAQKLDQP